LKTILPLLMALAGCERPNPLELVPVSLGVQGPAGFSCRAPGVCPDMMSTNCGPLLFERSADFVRPAPLGQGANPAFEGAPAVGSAVVDLLSLGPGPSDANPFVILNRCAQSQCKSILRKCFPLDLTQARDAVDRDGKNAMGNILDDIFTQLHASGALLTEDAPDVELAVRMVTTTLTCDQIATLPVRFSEWPQHTDSATLGKSIFGCGYAGPLFLDRASNLLFLGLPTLDAMGCFYQVAICANDLSPDNAGTLLGF
jgi:hypothetical protein